MTALITVPGLVRGHDRARETEVAGAEDLRNRLVVRPEGLEEERSRR